ncbi:MAG: hypothetical protein U5L95_01865 [Candidatus Saccharibacteria bacterium]|nr:hypothetical protein [Candidatus Saccharibacteria bacterium]
MPKKQAKTKRTKKTHKFFAFLVVCVLIIFGVFAYNKYKDWDNAQMIKGLSRDFPVLVEQIERETGLELEIESNCMTTQEKFSRGVSTCEYLVTKNPVNPQKLELQNKVLEEQQIFEKGQKFMNEEGYKFKYRNKNSCSFSYVDYVYLSCITAVRDANKDNLQELLSDS